jgi:hypothetical protein
MEPENKIEYFCIDSSNEFKLLDDMHRALVHDNFQKALLSSEENTYGNVFNTFFNKIIPLKSNIDLYSQNLSLLEKYLSTIQSKEVKDITNSMNFLLNHNFNNEFFLTKEIAESIGTILFYGFSKLKSKYKLYLIKSQADFKEKIERIKFNQVDLLNEYYNLELLENKEDKKLPKYIYRKDPYVTNDGRVFCKENKLLPNEIILLINKLQYVKTLTFKIDDIYSETNNNNNNNNLDVILYLIILINVQWLLPNILVVNFDLTNNYLSNSLIDIMSLRLNQELQGINIFEKKTFYPNNQIPYSTIYNFEMMIKYKEKELQEKENPNKKTVDIFQLFHQMKRNLNKQSNQKNNSAKKPDTNKEMLSFGDDENDSSDGEYHDYENYNMMSNETGVEDEEKKLNKEIINKIYKRYINMHNKELDMIVITASFIRIWDKLHALNIKCPDTYNSEIKESFFLKNIKIYNDLSFLNLLTEIKKLNILNIEFNCLDYMNFAKILGLISSNFNLSTLRLIFFSNDKFYSPGGIFKLLNDLNEKSIIQINKNIIKKKNSQNLKNTDFEELILNHYLLEKLQQNLEILCSLIKHHRKSLIEFVVILNLPTILINNDRYNLSLIKFIINILIFLAFDKHEIKVIKIISPLLKLDPRKNPVLSDLFNKITEVQHKKYLSSVHTLYLQLNLSHMGNITNLITKNLNTINIGNLDIPTFYSVCNLITSEEFINESKLINLKIVLQGGITKYDEEMKQNVLKLFKYNSKNMATMELITKLKVNYEDLCDIMNEIKKNYVNKYLITFNENSNAFIDKIIYNILPSVYRIDKNNEQKMKILAKCIMRSDIGKNTQNENDEEEKKIEVRKKVFNNIRMMFYERKEKDIKFHLNY